MLVSSGYCNGISSNRDDWAYDLSEENLAKKAKRFLDLYNGYVDKKIKSTAAPEDIKWSRDLKKKLDGKKKFHFTRDEVRDCCYRPFVIKKVHLNSGMIDVPGLFSQFFPEKKSSNLILSFQVTDRFPLSPFISDKLTDKNLLVADGAICVPSHYYSSLGTRLENVSDWGLKQFQNSYDDKKITKEAIFQYIYAVLNNPAYKEKYADNLKMEYPRIPFYDDFNRWTEWGKKLIDLHIGYEKAKPYKKLSITSIAKKNDPLLKLNKEEGIITLDMGNIISGIPIEAFNYKLGNKSSIEWVLKACKPQKYNPDKEHHHKILAADFNHYDWLTIRAKLLDVIPRLITVSLETSEIHKAMRQASET